jgi:threonine synthase
MKYISTRQCAPEVDIGRAILDGLAPDGGLYVPSKIPKFESSELAKLSDAEFRDLSCAIFQRFVGDVMTNADLAATVDKACSAFKHPSVVPLVEIGQRLWVMELFHGPTLAFKDLAMQFLAPMMGHFLSSEGRDAFILCATSGDTGGAALSAFQNMDHVRSLVLYPKGGVSTFQENQMQHLTTGHSQAVAVDGTFDDCQRIVKAILANDAHKIRFSLTAVNSVNWGRIMAQTVYFAKASLALASEKVPVNFVVPTGNFGNAYAGIIAKRMGFPIGKIIVATNENDTLHRAIEDGVFEPGKTVGTNTPAMDIQAPSNFERIVFDADRSPNKSASRQFVGTLKQVGKAVVPSDVLGIIREDILTLPVSQDVTARQIKKTYQQTGYMVDPHTALALAASAQLGKCTGATVALATAHPVKFSQTVIDALGTQDQITAYRGASFEAAIAPPALAATEKDILRQLSMIAQGQRAA